MTSEQENTAQPSSEQPQAEEPTNGRRRALFIVLLLFALAALGVGIYWWSVRNLESTDDAFIAADVVQVAPRVSGAVTQVLVSDNQVVKAGDLLVKLDPSDYQAAVARAQANLAAAQASHRSSMSDVQLTRATGTAGIDSAKAALTSVRAEARNAQANLKRYQTLYSKDEISQQRVDQAKTAADTATARVQQARAELARAKTAPQQLAAKQAQTESASANIAQARAALEQAQLNLSYTQIRAPQAGKIAQKSVLAGSRVAPGQAMMAVVADNAWIVANFKETQLTRIRPGQPVDIAVDAYPDRTFHGHVQSVQSGTGAAFSLLPPQNATGNFVKVVQRVPVKIVFDDLPDPHPVLAPGMSAEPTVNVAPHAQTHTTSAN